MEIKKDKKEEKQQEKVMISACLLGITCRYDNKKKPLQAAVQLCKKGNIIPVCPEQLGGLSTPRSASGIETGKGEDVLNGKSKVINKKGEDVTKEFIKGAEEVLKIAKIYGVKKFIAKSKSPSCGLGITLKRICVKGEVLNIKVKGDGVTVAFLKRNGLEIVTENDLK